MGDELQIRALQQAYASSFDARDVDAFTALYTEDAVIEPPGGKPFSGYDKLRKAILRTPPGGWHRSLESEIQFDGDDAAGRCRFEAQDLNGDFCTGYYQDEYRRTPLGWRISRRKVVEETRTSPVPSTGTAENQ